MKQPFSMKWLKIDASAIAACLATTGLVYLVGFMPLLAQRESLGSQRQELEQQQEKIERLQATSRNLRSRLATAQALLSKNKLKLQSARVLNQRLAELAEFSQKAGLDLQDVRPGLLARTSRYSQMQIHVSGIGNYPACTQYFRDLHQRFGDMAILSFELRNSATPNVPATFTINIAWFVDPE